MTQNGTKKTLDQNGLKWAHQDSHTILAHKRFTVNTDIDEVHL